MTRVSARRYLAAALATAIAGAGSVSPALVRRQIQPPAVPTNVALVSLESLAVVEMAAYVAVDVEKARGATQNTAADASLGAPPPMVGAADGLLAPKATITASTQAVRRGSAASPHDVTGVKILGVPLLIATLGLDVVANSAEAISDASFGIGNIMAGVAIQDPVQIRLGFDELREIPGDFGHLVFNVETHVRQIAAALGLGPDALALKRPMAPRSSRATVGADTPASIGVGGVEHPATDDAKAAHTRPTSARKLGAGGNTGADGHKGVTSVGDVKTSKPTGHSPSSSSGAKRNIASSADNSKAGDSSVPSGRTSTPSAHVGVSGVKPSATSAPKKRDGGAKSAKKGG